MVREREWYDIELEGADEVERGLLLAMRQTANTDEAFELSQILSEYREFYKAS